jgi:hypothetical protein
MSGGRKSLENSYRALKKMQKKRPSTAFFLSNEAA